MSGMVGSRGRFGRGGIALPHRPIGEIAAQVQDVPGAGDVTPTAILARGLPPCRVALAAGTAGASGRGAFGISRSALSHRIAELERELGRGPGREAGAARGGDGGMARRCCRRWATRWSGSRRRWRLAAAAAPDPAQHDEHLRLELAAAAAGAISGRAISISTVVTTTQRVVDLEREGWIARSAMGSAVGRGAGFSCCSARPRCRWRGLDSARERGRRIGR